jgi:hypothetical protein
MADLAGKALALLGIIAAIFAVLFLGGLASAWFEIRAEKRAGKTPTRPGWDRRDRRIAQGGHRAALRIWWESKTHRIPSCGVCGRGPLVPFDACDSFPAGLGCAAWEAGDVDAIVIHDRAGGYARSVYPVGLAS